VDRSQSILTNTKHKESSGGPKELQASEFSEFGPLRALETGLNHHWYLTRSISILCFGCRVGFSKMIILGVAASVVLFDTFAHILLNSNRLSRRN
jgi:hypothetical protein